MRVIFLQPFRDKEQNRTELVKVCGIVLKLLNAEYKYYIEHISGEPHFRI